MHENRTSLPSLTIAGGGILVAVLSIMGLLPSTSRDSTPIQSSKQTTDEYPTVDDTISRSTSQWDDPFIHSSDAANDAKTSPANDAKTSARELIQGKLESSNGNLLLLVIPLKSGFEPEHVEARRRARHAFELAVANQGFTTVFPDRMTYRKVKYEIDFLPLPAASMKKTETKFVQKKEQSAWLPTKLYSDPKGDLIAVTWIQDSQLGVKPLNVVQKILKDLVPSSQPKAEERKQKTSFCLLPSSSDLFRLIADEAKAISSYKSVCESGQDPSGCESEDALGVQDFFLNHIGGGAVLCNAVCTASDNSLGLKEGATAIEFGKRDNGAVSELRIVHTIDSDESLFTALCRELRLRGVLTTEKNRNITVIFAEQSSQAYLNDLQNYFDTSSGGDPPLIIPYLKGIASRAGQSHVEAGPSALVLH